MSLLRWWPLAVVGAVALGLSCYAGAIGRDAQTRAEIARLTRALATARGRLPVTDTVYVRDTLTLTRTRRVTDSLLITDTVIRADTVRLLVERERLACDAVVRTCETRIAERNVVIAGQDSLIAQLRKRSPFLLRIGKPVLPFLGGVITGLIVRR